MRRLPLYPEPLKAPVEAPGERLPVDPSCRRCALGGLGEKTCISAEAVIGKDRAHGLVWVVDHAPTLAESAHGRPFMTRLGRQVREVVRKHWPGDFVLDYAVRCAPGSDKEALLDAMAPCAPYLRGVFDQAMPDRIIVLGGQAARGVLGRYVSPQDTRKNYSWVLRPDGRRIPVLVLMHHDVTENRHLLRWLEEDFEWALGPIENLSLMPSPDVLDFLLIETREDAEEAAEALRAHDWVAYDCETAGKAFSDFFEIASLAVTASDAETTFVWGRDVIHKPHIRQPLLDLLADPIVGKVGANEKYDDQAVRAAFGVVVKGHVLDVQLTKHLDLPGSDASLETLSETVGMGGYKQDFGVILQTAVEQVRRARRKNAEGKQGYLFDESPVFLAAVAHPDEDPETYAYALVPSPHLERYNARDTVCTARAALGRYGFPLVQKHAHHKHIWKSLVRRTTPVVEQVEAWGIGVSRSGVQNFNRYVSNELAAVERRIERYSINPASPQQVAKLLFDKFGLKNPQNPKSRSTDGKALKAMQKLHPVVNDLREHRRLYTLRKNYGGLDRFVRSDGRVHPTFKIDGAGTGRLSCTDPPLHQIPRSKDGEGHTEGALIKNCFVAAPGYKLVQLDQSQVELRAAAALSQDPVMLEMFQAGTDFHLQAARLVAPLMWKVAAEAVTDAHRSATKSFVFGLIYGMQDATMAAKIGCSVQDAARLRAAILGKFKRLARWIEDQLAYARKHGCVITPWYWQDGRERQLPDIGIRDENLRGLKITAENGAFNTPCQSLGSDIVLEALCTIVEELPSMAWLDARVVLTVHDSIVAEVREDQVDDYIGFARPIMTRYEMRGVPLVVDAEVGDALGSLVKLKSQALAA